MDLQKLIPPASKELRYMECKLVKADNHRTSIIQNLSMTHTAQPIPLRLLLLNIHRRHIVISSSKKVMNNLPFITQALFFFFFLF